MTTFSLDSRRSRLNTQPVDPQGRLVLYWMQQAQRADDNHALETAIGLANTLRMPVAVLFVLHPRYPGANLRHFTFLLEGLRETADRLRARGVGWTTALGDPEAVVPGQVRQLRAAALVTDRGYLNHQRQWRQRIAADLPVVMEEVDTDCVIPCAAFAKEEYSARTFRGRYLPQLPFWLAPVEADTPVMPAPALPKAFDADDPAATLRLLPVGTTVAPSVSFRGGATEAERRLAAFCRDCLPGYAGDRQDAAADAGSHLSPYLHYGHISPLRIALAVQQAGLGSAESTRAYLEELLIRRELCINFAWHNRAYDTPAGWPNWGRATLEAHRDDPRPAGYTREQLEAGETGDAVWDAAQKELLAAGTIHNYPRMLWAKRLLAWTPRAEDAWEIAVEFNDRYALDGRDASGYANIAWCLAGKHDRPWPARPIYGTVRFMSTARANQHFPVREYLARVNGLCAAAGLPPVAGPSAGEA